MKFIVDSNVGKLAKWLRIAGYDTVFVNNIDDNRLVRIALDQDRVLLTKDTHILKRRVVTSGRLKVVLIEHDNITEQLNQVFTALNLTGQRSPFSLCIECNEPLVSMKKSDVKNLVPPYVFETQDQYMRCPRCHRIYWRGTHWERMSEELERIAASE